MLLIKSGRLMTMTGQEPFIGDILCRKGKIERIGTQIELPDGETEVIDASGCLVLPGLIDAHCHVGITEEKKGIEGDDCNENVEPVTPWLRALDAINTMDSAFEAAVHAGITAVMAGPGSTNVVGGQFALLKTKGRCIDDLIVRAPAAMKVAFGENPKVNFSGLERSPVTRMAIAGMLRRELFEAKKYYEKRKDPDTVSDATDINFDLEPWMPVFDHEIPLKAHVHRVDDIFTAIRIAKEFGLDMTLDHCSEGHLIADRIAESGFPAIVGPDLSSRSKIEIQHVDFKTAGVLHRAGVLVAVCTDHPVSTIQSLPLCAGLAVKEGLPAEEGLRAITCNPAKICRVFDRVGSLEAGKDADIAVFTGSPLEVSGRVRFTIIDGKVAYRG